MTLDCSGKVIDAVRPNHIKLFVLLSLFAFLFFSLWPCLVYYFKHMFSVFKQHYTYFYTLFHLHVFPKKTEKLLFKHTYQTGTITKTALTNSI